jgi:hypothetical protein
MLRILLPIALLLILCNFYARLFRLVYVYSSVWHIIRNVIKNVNMDNELKKSGEASPPEGFKTDSQKIVQRHLKDENDIITEQDIRSVRIGVTPPSEANPKQKMEQLIDEVENESKSKKDSDVGTTDDPITPWDAVQR